jgi:hypothetical protein
MTMPFDDFQRDGRFYHAELTDGQLVMARLAYQAVGKYIDPTFEAFERNVLTNMHPDRELQVWSIVADALLLYCETYRATPHRELASALRGVSLGHDKPRGVSGRVFDGLTTAFEATVQRYGYDKAKRFPPMAGFESDSEFFVIYKSPIMRRLAETLGHMHVDRMTIGDAIVVDGIRIEAVAPTEAHALIGFVPAVQMVLLMDKVAA